MKVFVGFEPKAAAAYWMLRASIVRYAPDMYDKIFPIVQQHLRIRKLYDRPFDPLASTEFTYTRFFTPFLMDYDGWALFMDVDMMLRGDIMGIMEYADKSLAVSCVQHQHIPTEMTKMTVAGQPSAQTVYRRKNWSSVMLFNCGHLDCRNLTPEIINTASPAYLHQMDWTSVVGDIPVEWNWLEGWNTLEECPEPKIVHFTRGIPGIHDGCSSMSFADEFIALANTGELR